MSEQFPRAPLVSAIFQLRFGGETAVETARPLIQEAVRQELPKLYVPMAIPRVAPALQGYAFRSEDASEGIDLALNAFTYVTVRYEGFEKFSERCRRFLRIFQEHVQVHQPNRLGLRYVNHIPVLRESRTAPIPLDDYVTLGFVLPPVLGSANFIDIGVTLRVPIERGIMRIQLEHKTEDQDKEALLLDFDYSEEDRITVSEVPAYLERAHAVTKRLFIEIVSPQYLEMIRRDE